MPDRLPLKKCAKESLHYRRITLGRGRALLSHHAGAANRPDAGQNPGDRDIFLRLSGVQPFLSGGRSAPGQPAGKCRDGFSTRRVPSGRGLADVPACVSGRKGDGHRQTHARCDVRCDLEERRAAVFDPATQRAKQPAPSISDAAQFYAQAAGVKREAFLATAGSFVVDVRIPQADELIRNYGISETPSIVVNGKYRLNPVSAGGYKQTIELVKWLVAQEGPAGNKK